MWRTLFAALVILAASSASSAAAQRSIAFVQSDGTLKIRGQIVRLHGIFQPRTNRVCRFEIRPVRCGSRAVEALEFRVDRMVTCQKVRRNRDRSVNAFCYVRDDDDPFGPFVDLGAWLIYFGWAVATPEAPFEYRVYEEIARENGRGIWGFPADSIIIR